MIDWLNVELPLIHDPISQGRRIMIDHDGTISSDFVIGRAVGNDDAVFGGSYSSKIMISSIDTPYTVAKAGDCEIGKCSGISIRGNPTKFLQGHNVFGISCVRSLLIQTIRRVLPQLGFRPLEVQRACHMVSNWQFLVCKVDITYMFDLGTNADVDSYLRMLPFTATARGDRAQFDRNTWYLGKHSGLWSLKMYNKFKELTSRSKKHQLPLSLQNCGIDDFAYGKLRVELVLQKQQLVRLGMTCPQKLQKSLAVLFDDFTGKVTMNNQQISEKDVIKLPEEIQLTFVRWQKGENLKGVYKNDKYYRHRRKLLEYGVDIAKRPIPVEERIAVVRPLKVLRPRMVTEIPQELQKYCVQKVA